MEKQLVFEIERHGVVEISCEDDALHDEIDVYIRERLVEPVFQCDRVTIITIDRILTGHLDDLIAVALDSRIRAVQIDYQASNRRKEDDLIRAAAHAHAPILGDRRRQVDRLSHATLVGDHRNPLGARRVEHHPLKLSGNLIIEHPRRAIVQDGREPIGVILDRLLYAHDCWKFFGDVVLTDETINKLLCRSKLFNHFCRRASMISKAAGCSRLYCRDAGRARRCILGSINATTLRETNTMMWKDQAERVQTTAMLGIEFNPLAATRRSRRGISIMRRFGYAYQQLSRRQSLR